MHERQTYGSVHVLPDVAVRWGWSENKFVVIGDRDAVFIRKDVCSAILGDSVGASFPCRVVVRRNLFVSPSALRYAEEHDCRVVATLQGDVFVPNDKIFVAWHRQAAGYFVVFEDQAVSRPFKNAMTACEFQTSRVEFELPGLVNPFFSIDELEHVTNSLKAFFHGMPQGCALTADSMLRIPTEVWHDHIRTMPNQPKFSFLRVRSVERTEKGRVGFQPKGKKTNIPDINSTCVLTCNKSTQISLFRVSSAEDKIRSDTASRDTLDDHPHVIAAVNLLQFHYSQENLSNAPLLILITCVEEIDGNTLAKKIATQAGCYAFEMAFRELIRYLRSKRNAVLPKCKEQPTRNILVLSDDDRSLSPDEWTQRGCDDLKDFRRLVGSHMKPTGFRSGEQLILVTSSVHLEIKAMANLVIDADILPSNSKPDALTPTESLKRDDVDESSEASSPTSPITPRLYGLDEALRTLEIAFCLPQTSRNLPVRYPHGVLLYGPPGCGKTSIIKYLAEKRSMPVTHLDCSSVFSSFVGESERLLRKAFAEARARSPCILFIDEVEAIGGTRNPDTNDVATRLLSTLLAEIDGVTQSTGVVFVGATNAPNLIDPALMRPGRFDIVLQISLPDSTARETMIRSIFRKSQMRETDSTIALVRYLVTVTNGCSGASIESLVFAGVCRGIDRLTEGSMDENQIELRVEDFDVEKILQRNFNSQ